MWLPRRRGHVRVVVARDFAQGPRQGSTEPARELPCLHGGDPRTGPIGLNTEQGHRPILATGLVPTSHPTHRGTFGVKSNPAYLGLRTYLAAEGVRDGALPVDATKDIETDVGADFAHGAIRHLDPVRALDHVLRDHGLRTERQRADHSHADHNRESPPHHVLLFRVSPHFGPPSSRGVGPPNESRLRCLLDGQKPPTRRYPLGTEGGAWRGPRRLRGAVGTVSRSTFPKKTWRLGRSHTPRLLPQPGGFEGLGAIPSRSAQMNQTLLAA